jgi:hypothetical protein
MRPYYQTAGSQQFHNLQTNPQQYQNWQQQQQSQQHGPSQQLQPITPAAVAALAMSSFSRSNASTSTQHFQAPLPGSATNSWGYSLSSTYVPSGDNSSHKPQNVEHERHVAQQPVQGRPAREPRPFTHTPSEPSGQSRKRKREEEP